MHVGSKSKNKISELDGSGAVVGFGFALKRGVARLEISKATLLRFKYHLPSWSKICTILVKVLHLNI